MWPSHLLFMEISTECMCLRAWRAFLYIRMCFLLHIRLHAAFLQDIYIYSPYIMYISHFTFLTLFSQLILIHFLTTRTLSFTSSWHSCAFWWKTKGKIFFIILASLCSLLLVYINISYVYVWLRARTNPTQTSCYEGVFLFLITAIVCTLYTISTFTFFSFSSLALNRHFSLTLRSEFFFEKCTKKISKYTCKEKKKNDEKHAILSFAKEHTYFTRHIRPSRIGKSKEVWQLLWGGRSLKCWLSAFRFSFKYIGLFFLKMSLFSHLKVIKLSFTFTNFRNFSLHGMSPS